MTTHELVDAGLVALGLVAIAMALWQAMSSPQGVLRMLTWLVPAAIVWFLAVLVADPLPGVVLALVAMALYYSQMVSLTGNRWWSRVVLRSRDPWVLREVPWTEIVFLENLSNSLIRVTRTEAKFPHGQASPADLNRIESERAGIARLNPPDVHWADVVTEATTQLDLVLQIYANGETPSPTAIADEQARWRNLRAHMRALRYDRPWPEPQPK